MKRAPVSAGFTIVETMIVLAVTGLLFVSISGGFSGRRSNAEYKTSSSDARSRVQQIISEVQNGYFPATEDFVCTDAGAAAPLNISTIVGRGQGQNEECVFLGKAITFNDPTDPRILVIAGRSAATNIGNAAPTSVPQLRDRFQVPVDLTVTKVLLNDSTPVRGVGFFLNYQATGNNGQQAITTYGITNTNNIGGGGNIVTMSPGPIMIYMQSGGTDNCAKITIGAAGSNLDADLRTVSRAECT